jgi:uncharacterized protein YbjT (DUF2867 family)
MNKVLVTGATGTVGSGVVRDLQEKGIAVRVFVRDPDKAATMFGTDVEIVTGDFADRVSVQQAVAGVESVFLTCSAVPQQVDYGIGVIEAAREAGVRRIVQLSAHGAEVDSPVAFWDWQGRIEAHLRVSGIPAVVLRPTFKMTNLLVWADQVRRDGTLAMPANGARVAMIDPRDIAAVAAVALTEEGHEGQTYTVTGPTAITFEHVAKELSAVAGRPVQYIDLPDGTAGPALVELGYPEFAVPQIVTLFGILRRGDQGKPSGIVRDLTGRTPRSIAQFARDHAGRFQASA